MSAELTMLRTLKDKVHRAIGRGSTESAFLAGIEYDLCQIVKHAENNKPASPWIDASDRTPASDETRDSDRDVLLKLHSQGNSPIHVVGFFDAAGRVRESLDGPVVSTLQYPRIQWMEIPE